MTALVPIARPAIRRPLDLESPTDRAGALGRGRRRRRPRGDGRSRSRSGPARVDEALRTMPSITPRHPERRPRYVDRASRSRPAREIACATLVITGARDGPRSTRGECSADAGARSAVMRSGHSSAARARGADPAPPRRDLDLEQHRVALAAAGADRGEAEAAAVSAQLVDHRREDPRAGRADRDGRARPRRRSRSPSRGRRRACLAELSATEQKASFTSTRSTSPIVLPAFSSASGPALRACARGRRTRRRRRPGRRSSPAPRARASARTPRS